MLERNTDSLEIRLQFLKERLDEKYQEIENQIERIASLLTNANISLLASRSIQDYLGEKSPLINLKSNTIKDFFLGLTNMFWNTSFERNLYESFNSWNQKEKVIFDLLAEDLTWLYGPMIQLENLLDEYLIKQKGS